MEVCLLCKHDFFQSGHTLCRIEIDNMINIFIYIKRTSIASRQAVHFVQTMSINSQKTQNRKEKQTHQSAYL